MHEAVGRTQTLRDGLDPARAAALHATLARAGDPPGAGDALPPFWHQIHFWDAQPPAALGRDGHPPAEKVTTVADVAEKEGRSGRLGFVTLRHEIRQAGRLCVTERQDLVYREAPETRRSSPPPPEAPQDEAVAEAAGFDSTLLFRYSALTFNGHRIHYDLDYCRNVEGYAGLVVHGPLLAQLLMHLAERQLGGLRRFRFRATAPLMHDERAALCWGADGRCWVRGPDGRLCMEAVAG